MNRNCPLTAILLLLLLLLFLLLLLLLLLLKQINKSLFIDLKKIDYLQIQEYEYYNIYPMYILLVYERELSKNDYLKTLL